MYTLKTLNGVVISFAVALCPILLFLYAIVSNASVEPGWGANPLKIVDGPASSGSLPEGM